MKQITEHNLTECMLNETSNQHKLHFVHNQICWCLSWVSCCWCQPSCLASLKSGGTVIPRAYRVKFVVTAPSVVPTKNQSEYNSHSRHNISTSLLHHWNEPYNIAWLVVWCTDCTHLCLGQRYEVHLCVHCLCTQQRPPAGYHRRTPSHIHSSSVGLWRDLKPSPAPTEKCVGQAWRVCCDGTHHHTLQTQTDMTPPLHMQCHTVQVVECHELVSAPIAPWRCQTPQVFVLAPVTPSLIQATHPTCAAYCPQQQQHVLIWAVVHSSCDEQP